MSTREWTKERRSAMARLELLQGAVMSELNGWQQPLHYGDGASELKMLRESVGIYDLSPRGAVRLVGEDAVSLETGLFSGQKELAVGQARECRIAAENETVSLLELRLARDEFIFLTAPGDAETVTEFLRSPTASCAHTIDISSGLAGAGIVGPQATFLLSMITELDVSSEAFPSLRCVQSRFADVPGLLVRQDAVTGPAYQLYFTREYGEYIWEVITQAAHRIGGGAVGTEAIKCLQDGC